MKKLLARSLFALCLLCGCVTQEPFVKGSFIKEDWQSLPVPVDPVQYNKSIWLLKFLGDDGVLVEVTGPVQKLRSLEGKTAVTFTATAMPKDMEALLKKYAMTTGETFYEYTVRNTDRFIYCPQLKTGVISSELEGAAASGRYANYPTSWLYPNENITFIKMQPDGFDLYWAANAIVHEAAHQEVAQLVYEKKIPRVYQDNQNFNERHSEILSMKLLDAVKSGGHTVRFYDQILRRITRYNVFIGLAKEDRTLWPFIQTPEGLSAMAAPDNGMALTAAAERRKTCLSRAYCAKRRPQPERYAKCGLHNIIKRG